MPDEFTGTNTEKIEKLISAVVTLQTSARIAYWILGFTLPLLVGLGVFLVQRSYENSSKLDRLESRIDRLEYKLEGFEKEVARAESSRAERDRKLDATLERIERRLEALERRMPEPAIKGAPKLEPAPLPGSDNTKKPSTAPQQ